ncbi:MAG TPA: VIT1/CCC1 transporter family protein [Myxococcaceae bacterium]
MKNESADLARYRANWQEEIDSAARYLAMAEAERDPGRAQVYRDLAAMEDKHAGFWEKRLSQAGVAVGPRRLSTRARILIWLARRLGPEAILATVASDEQAGRTGYDSQPETSGTRMRSQERMHARLLGSLVRGGRGASGAEVGRLEGRHRNIGGNALRAAVLGANDGLSSNLSLVMGVAGAATDQRAVLLAGIAGLVAGAGSMALGEWVSVTSSRELAQRELETERTEIELEPEDEREELELLYRAKGLSDADAKALSAELMAKPGAALDVLAREELGIDPEELGGSPVTAAATSFLLFAVGAAIPVIPFLLARGTTAIAASVAVSAAALFAIGAAITLFTGRSVLRTGFRQLVLGLGAAALTFAIGRLVGVAVGG